MRCRNLALLQQSGAELVPFSPLQEQQLPASISGIYLGGGYPELYSQQLAANICMLASVRAFAAAGGVIFAECGGLMYLGQSIEQQHGSVDRMGEQHGMTSWLTPCCCPAGHGMTSWLTPCCCCCPAGHGIELPLGAGSTLLTTSGKACCRALQRLHLASCSAATAAITARLTTDK